MPILFTGIARIYNRYSFDLRDFDKGERMIIHGCFATMFKSFWAWMFEHKVRGRIELKYDYSETVKKDNYGWNRGNIVFWKDGKDILQVINENVTGKIIIDIIVSEKCWNIHTDNESTMNYPHLVKLGFTRPKDAMMVKMILA